jgi:drug/metabolite transporter (DMT)-like permease
VSTGIFLAILAAALMHAGWNAIVKIGLDRLLAITLVAGSAAAVSLPLLAFVDTPVPASWPWMAASIAMHIGYNIALARAYEVGDLGLVYPIARGTAPLLTAIVGTLVLREYLTLAESAGILTLVGGVWLMATRGRVGNYVGPNAVVPALITSLFISGYSLSDGLGARASGTASGYTLWLFVLDGLVMIAVVAGWRGRTAIVSALPYWRSGLIGGTLSLGAYWIVIWAMTKAPIALVAALRESSVLFAALISVAVLGEPLKLSRGLAAVLIAAGVMLIRLA